MFSISFSSDKLVFETIGMEETEGDTEDPFSETGGFFSDFSLLAIFGSLSGARGLVEVAGGEGRRLAVSLEGGTLVSGFFVV